MVKDHHQCRIPCIHLIWLRGIVTRILFCDPRRVLGVTNETVAGRKTIFEVVLAGCIPRLCLKFSTRHIRICTLLGATVIARLPLYFATGILLAMLPTISYDASAQATTPECTNSPDTGERVLCQESASSTDDITITLSGENITTTEPREEGIKVIHKGLGDITITVKGNTGVNGQTVRSVINTSDAKGVYAEISGTPTGMSAGRKNIVITVTDTDITTGYTPSNVSNSGDGISAWYSGTTPNNMRAKENIGDITINVRNTTVTLEGPGSGRGISGLHQGRGSVGLDIRNTHIKTKGSNSYAIYGKIDDIPDAADNRGNITIYADDVEIKTEGQYSHGILGVADPGVIGNIEIDVLNSTIETKGTAAPIYGSHKGKGNIVITARGGSRIVASGANSVGIHARQTFEPEDQRGEITINAGGSIDVIGMGGQGIRIGWIDGDVAKGAASFDEHGYRRQKVFVKGSVRGGAGISGAGLTLAGGGRVFIKPKGSVGARSGVAVHVSGAKDGDPTVKPKLYIEIEPGGRRMAEVIGDDWIINDEGETAIVVNGVTLHDGENGATGETVDNGIFVVGMKPQGVRVTDRTVPGKFVTELSTVPADRDFSANDFVERYILGAAYEISSGFLLHMINPRIRSAWVRADRDNPTWIAVYGSWDRFVPATSRLGAQYMSKDLSLEIGRHFELGDSLDGSVALGSILWGSAEVSAPFGNESIEVGGTYASLNLRREWTSGIYARGDLSFGRYSLGFASDRRGRLKTGAKAHAHSLHVETGWQTGLNSGKTLSTRIWTSQSRAEITDFIDSVGNRVSFDNATQNMGGIGLTVGKVYGLDRLDRVFSLDASIDLERTLSNATRTTRVFDEKIFSVAPKNRIRVNFGGTWRNSRHELSASVAAIDTDSDDLHYYGQIAYRINF